MLGDINGNGGKPTCWIILLILLACQSHSKTLVLYLSQQKAPYLNVTVDETTTADNNLVILIGQHLQNRSTLANVKHLQTAFDVNILLCVCRLFQGRELFTL